MNNNPIFVEYYSHESCDCYKILNPWTKYRQEKLVLCRVEEGIELAKERAMEYLTKNLESALNEPLPKDICIECEAPYPCSECPNRPIWKR